MHRNTRLWIAAGVAVFLLIAVAVGVGVYMFMQAGFTRQLDNMFGDQHLKTVVALVELHKTRNGKYPRKLTELKFTGQWDQIALNAVSYCASEHGDAYYVEVERGWVGRPGLELPPEFWQGTGFRPDVGPCR